MKSGSCHLGQTCWKGTNCSAASGPSAPHQCVAHSGRGELNFTPCFRNIFSLEGLQCHPNGPWSPTQKASVLPLSEEDDLDKGHELGE